MIKRTPILKVSGKDAQSFLQGQLSNDINKIVDEQWQLNAYCQHQGQHPLVKLTPTSSISKFKSCGINFSLVANVTCASSIDFF
jgi:hypothetical protein